MWKIKSKCIACHLHVFKHSNTWQNMYESVFLSNVLKSKNSSKIWRNSSQRFPCKWLKTAVVTAKTSEGLTIKHTIWETGLFV